MDDQKIKYYAIVKNKKLGPLSLVELLQFNLYEETLIWRSDRPDWEKAISFPELIPTIIPIPPPVPNKIKFKRLLSKSLLIYLIISFAIGLLSYQLALPSSKEIYFEYQEQSKAKTQYFLLRPFYPFIDFGLQYDEKINPRLLLYRQFTATYLFFGIVLIIYLLLLRIKVFKMSKF